MPDITFPNTFVAGNVLDPDAVSANIFKHESTPQTLEVINGHLDQDNLAAATTIGRNETRRRTSATAITRGHTANLDFYDDMFQGDYAAHNHDTAVAHSQVVVGTTFYVPYTCEAVYLSWHVGLIIDAGFVYSSTAGPGIAEGDSTGDGIPDTTGLAATPAEIGNTLLSLHIDGHYVKGVSRRALSGLNTMLGTTLYQAGTLKSLPTAVHADEQWNDPLAPDHRWWSGHCVIDQVNGDTHIPAGEPQLYAKGWHTLDIRVTNGRWIYNAVTKNVRQVKFKTCRATAIPLR